MLNTGRAVGVARRRSSGAVAQRFPSSGLVSQDPNAIWNRQFTSQWFIGIYNNHYKDPYYGWDDHQPYSEY